jgi:D-3-phosphoglycerate dehydrogenase
VVEEYGVKLVSLDELLKTSDYVSVHAPLSEKTRGMISEKEFALMKDSAVIINTARGPVVDEEALIEALESGRIAFAALDVTAKEPPAPNNPLRKMKNVILTPHLAWYSERSARLAGEKAGEDVVRALNGYFPKYLVNTEVRKSRPDLKYANQY